MSGIFTLKGPVATAEVLLLKARLWLDVCLDEVFSFKWINFKGVGSLRVVLLTLIVDNSLD